VPNIVEIAQHVDTTVKWTRIFFDSRYTCLWL